jgi:hypothetical protein
MKRKVIFLMILTFSVGCAYSENVTIVIGKHYSNVEVNNLLPYLSLFSKVELIDRILCVYKLDGSKRLDDKKLCVLSDVSGKLLDAFGVRFLDSNSWHSVVSETNCVVQIKLNTDPIHNLIFAASGFDRIIVLPIEHNFVADICVSNGKIYYSTEFSNDTIYCIEIATGKTYKFTGYYPNVDLFEFADGEKRIIVFDYDGKQYILKDDRIILATKQYDILKNKKNLSDYKNVDTMVSVE